MTRPVDEVGGLIIDMSSLDLLLDHEERVVSLMRCADGRGGLDVLCRG